jgi:hypothetical protein
MFSMKKPAAVAAGVVAVFAIGTGGAVAGNLVTSADIKDDTIRSKDIADGTVRIGDLRSGAISELKGKTGPAGTNGTNGINGTNGKNGTNGVSGYEVQTYDYIAGKQDTPAEPGMGPDYAGAGQGAIATVACSDVTKKAVGGGYWFKNAEAATEGWSAIASFPGRMDWDTVTPKPGLVDGWIVQLNAPTPVTPVDLTMYVICVNA